MSKPWELSPSASTEAPCTPFSSLPGTHSHYPSPFSNNLGGLPSYGGYGGYGGYPGQDVPHLWSGFLGQAAEHLGRLNNFLSLSAAVVENLSGHSRLLAAKGKELQVFGNFLVEYLDKKWPELRTHLGLDMRLSEEEKLRRRVRAGGAAGVVFLFLFFLLRRRRRRVDNPMYGLDQVFNSISR